MENEVEESAEVVEFDPCTRAESAANIYSTFAEMDVEIMTAEDKKRVKEIRRMSIKIAHYYLKQIYDGI
jgi:hypothetical protein